MVGAVWGFLSLYTLFTAVCVREPAGKDTHTHTNTAIMSILVKDGSISSKD